MFLLGNVDFASLPWDFFWVAVAYFMVTGVLFCFSILRFAQQRKKSGVVFIVGAAISAAYFLNYFYTNHI
ncbi:hypothetical protein T458_00955 [Brevibacillus panacihumi W25]|uniref:Uncharacterized protein n=1 Tax=Brevibacillus panacihumi W25 TaxID=1408254 RepID=V6MFP1_9BACL|nr:hypothetical protein [Brevibacillus panacihumi]EST56735.1 hypothetical protein T458_00955 [Brevibacillus panacihumi W25]